jgi:FkbM family methyltransferase
MYRACSTWQYGVAGQLLERYPLAQRLGFVDGGRFVSEVEPGLDRSAWGVLKVHDAHEHYAGLLVHGRALAIYSHRDLRDVAFSWMHKTGTTFEEVVSSGFFDRCLRNDRFWRLQPGMLLQTYEGLIADPVRGVAEIAQHLGISLEESEAQAIADSLSFEANQKRTADLANRLVANGIPLSSKDQDSYDPASLLHWNHLRSGKVGDWREQATPEQRATLGRICGSWLIEHGYEVDDAWSRDSGSNRSLSRPPEPRISFAADGEDILLDRVFQGQTGTFVDIGARHPRSKNKTFYFYLRGWRGVNIEPASGARDCFESVRPGDFNLAYAISDTSGELSFFEIPGREGMSTLSHEVAEKYLALGHSITERRVPVRTVANLVEQYQLKAPEICSISVAGDADRVIRGIPLAIWRPKVFVIESNRPTANTPCQPSWEPILLEHGYLFAMFDGINRFYLRGDLADALPLFDCPVNSLDFYERAETVEQRHRADSLQNRYEEERRRVDEARAQKAEAEHARGETIAGFMAERDAWQRERDAWQRERDAWQMERDAVTRERDAWQMERDAVQRERDAITRERDAWQIERDRVQEERIGVAHRIASQADETRQVRDELARTRITLEAERARFDLERQARNLEVEAARSELRPYRLIDRLGVVTALHRRVNAVNAVKARVKSR